jgi:hypothetical protein
LILCIYLSTLSVDQTSPRRIMEWLWLMNRKEYGRKPSWYSWWTKQVLIWVSAVCPANHYPTIPLYSSVMPLSEVRNGSDRQHIITASVFKLGLHLWPGTWLVT